MAGRLGLNASRHNEGMSYSAPDFPNTRLSGIDSQLAGEVTKVKVARSRIHGRGLFASEPIEAGAVIATRLGELLSFVEGDPPPAASNPNWIGVAPDTWIDPAYPFDHINHSCEPSCAIRGDGELVALAALNTGDELTFDYSTTEADAEWLMICSCGTASCRGTLAAVHFAYPDEGTAPDGPDAIVRFWRIVVAKNAAA